MSTLFSMHMVFFFEVESTYLNGALCFLSSDDEPEGPEDIPEHELGMKCGRVICTNYSLLYDHLDPYKLLPKLPEKDLINEEGMKLAETYLHRFAKNVVLIRVLLWYDRPAHGLLKFCDTLETTPGQEHLGKKLLKGSYFLNCC